MRHPTVLTPTELPLAELSAARLDGDLVEVGDAFTPFDEIDGPALRAASLLPGLHPRLIAEHETAAWIWGARERPPIVRRFCVRLDSRVGRRNGGAVAVREVAIDDDEIETVAGLSVTSVLRTVTDLARHGESFDEMRRDTVARLLDGAQLGLDDCVQSLDRRSHLPHRRRAVARIAEAIASSSPARQPALTRYTS